MKNRFVKKHQVGQFYFADFHLLQGLLIPINHDKQGIAVYIMKLTTVLHSAKIPLPTRTCWHNYIVNFITILLVAITICDISVQKKKIVCEVNSFVLTGNSLYIANMIVFLRCHYTNLSITITSKLSALNHNKILYYCNCHATISSSVHMFTIFFHKL